METPRVSCSHLNSYINRNVLVVGKVVQLRDDSAIMDADGHITVNLNRVCSGGFCVFRWTFRVSNQPGCPTRWR